MVAPINYLISAVRYNLERTLIVEVKRHLYQVDTVAIANIVNRYIVYDDLSKGLKYKTIYRDQDKWKLGEDILLIPNSGLITSDPTIIDRDNLGNLPEF